MPDITEEDDFDEDKAMKILAQKLQTKKQVHEYLDMRSKYYQISNKPLYCTVKLLIPTLKTVRVPYL